MFNGFHPIFFDMTVNPLITPSRKPPTVSVVGVAVVSLITVGFSVIIYLLFLSKPVDYYGWERIPEVMFWLISWVAPMFVGLMTGIAAWLSSSLRKGYKTDTERYASYTGDTQGLPYILPPHTWLGFTAGIISVAWPVYVACDYLLGVFGIRGAL